MEQVFDKKKVSSLYSMVDNLRNITKWMEQYADEKLESEWEAERSYANGLKFAAEQFRNRMATLEQLTTEIALENGLEDMVNFLKDDLKEESA